MVRLAERCASAKESLEEAPKWPKESRNSLNAIHELLCVVGTMYGEGQTLCLKTQSAECERVTIKKTIGEGGSKKAAVLEDGRVIMFPNIDVEPLSVIYDWPASVKNECAMTSFLDSIGVPALNRKQAYLMVPSVAEAGTIYPLSVMVSDSFTQMASKGWYIFDSKNPYLFNTLKAAEAREEWKFEVNKTSVIPLLKDLWTVAKNGASLNGDSYNTATVKNEDGTYALRYFGFDFGGKTGTLKPPSSKNQAISLKIDNAHICGPVSKWAKFMIDNFVSYRGGNGEEAAENYGSCDFIIPALSGDLSGETTKQDANVLDEL